MIGLRKTVWSIYAVSRMNLMTCRSCGLDEAEGYGLTARRPRLEAKLQIEMFGSMQEEGHVHLFRFGRRNPENVGVTSRCSVQRWRAVFMLFRLLHALIVWLPSIDEKPNPRFSGLIITIDSSFSVLHHTLLPGSLLGRSSIYSPPVPYSRPHLQNCY